MMVTTSSRPGSFGLLVDATSQVPANAPGSVVLPQLGRLGVSCPSGFYAQSDGSCGLTLDPNAFGGGAISPAPTNWNQTGDAACVYGVDPGCPNPCPVGQVAQTGGTCVDCTYVPGTLAGGNGFTDGFMSWFSNPVLAFQALTNPLPWQCLGKSSNMWVIGAMATPALALALVGSLGARRYFR